MPTYDYACEKCGREDELFRTISDYLHNPLPLFCCGVQMQRRIKVAPGLAVHNALAGDRHYDGLRASDGTDISTRSKHRQYMRERGLTTVDDYRGEWARAAKERAELREGVDPSRRPDIVRAIAELENKR